ncbi:MAG: hypothetical protein QM638_20675 [Nocardioides sp.]|uniref:hypothetical protein n=1 Tax=Nocardioides sp. TaxID=35761 RepID=UPI0039E5F84B
MTRNGTAGASTSNGPSAVDDTPVIEMRIHAHDMTHRRMDMAPIRHQPLNPASPGDLRMTGIAG